MATRDDNRGCRSCTSASIRHPPPAWVTFEAAYFVTVTTKYRGINQLCLPEVASGLTASVTLRDERGTWRTLAYVLMPDHVHLLIVVADARRLLPLLTAWKRYTARHLKIHWRHGFFERRVRRADSIARTVEYIRQNPVRAGLARRPDDWPYLWVR